MFVYKNTKNREGGTKISITKNAVVKIVDHFNNKERTEAIIDFYCSYRGYKKIMIVTRCPQKIMEEVNQNGIKQNFLYFPHEVKNKDNGHRTPKEDLQKLIVDNKNVIIHHRTFEKLDETTLKRIRSKNYILLVDGKFEALNRLYSKNNSKTSVLVYNEPNISEKQVKAFQETGIISVDDDNRVSVNNEFLGVSNVIKQLDYQCKKYEVYKFGDSFYKLLNIELFKVFDEIYLYTFGFQHQLLRNYFDKQKIEYKYYHLEYKKEGQQKKFHYFVEDGYVPVNRTEIDAFDALIYIYEFIENKHKYNLNDIGNEITSFSSQWFQNHDETVFKTNKALYDEVSKHINYWHKNKHRNLTIKDIYWTTYKKALYSLTCCLKEAWLPYNLTLTEEQMNELSNKWVLAYCINNYLSQDIKTFFNVSDQQEDKIALLELLDFIKASSIQHGECVDIYIPSLRMRNLLQAFLKRSPS